MEDEQEQFTRRMLRRAGLKKDNGEVSNFSSLRRKLNILRAIEVNNSHNEQIIDTGGVEKNRGKTSKKESKMRLKKNVNSPGTKNNFVTSGSWSKIPSSYLESFQSSVKSHESPDNLTIDEFFHKDQFLEQKEDNSFNLEKSLKFEKDNLSPKSDSIKNTSSINYKSIPSNKADFENTVEWEETVKKCINNFFENMSNKNKNLDVKQEEKMTFSTTSQSNFTSPKNDFVSSSQEFFSPKSELLSHKTDFFSPTDEFLSTNTEKTEYFSPENNMNFSESDVEKVVSKDDLPFPENDPSLPEADRHFQKPDLTSARLFNEIEVENQKSEIKIPTVPEDFINELSLSTFMKGLKKDNLDKKDEEWKDATEFFENTTKQELPELLKVTYKMTPLAQKGPDFKIFISTCDIKTSTLPVAESISQNLENLNESQSENESMFHLESVIKNLDEEINNLQIRPAAKKLEKVIETPKKLLALNKSPSGLTPRKLFHTNIEDSENQSQGPVETKNEEINKDQLKNKETVESNKESIEIKEKESEQIFQDEQENCSLVDQSLPRRNSSIFRFKTPKFWKPKPNLESTRKASNADLTKKTTTSPSQVGSTISSINPNSPASPAEGEKKSERVFETSISFEVEKFLEEALGEELYSTSMTYGLDNTKDKTMDVTEFMSDRSSHQSWLLNSPERENRRFSRHSTLNRTISVYRSLSKRIKKKFRPSLKDTMKEVAWNPILPISERLNEKIKPLIHEINIQQTRIYQASKALDYCRSMKQFQASPEQVESNRLLLLANLKKQALFQEIKAIASGPTEERLYTQQAEITVQNIVLTLKEDFLKEGQNYEVVEWFVVVISQGLTVWATQPIACSRDSLKISFPGLVAIPDMNPDFKIIVRVFSTKFENVAFSHADKYHIQEKDKNTTCPSPTKLLKRSERLGSLRSHEVKFSGIRETSFTLTGNVELQVHDLTLFSPWPLMSVPKNSVLHNIIDIDLTCRLDLTITHAGFLNYGDEMGGFAVWNRRWCVLQKNMLMFWNYPREQGVKQPLIAINLADCLNDQVSTISRTLCARPRTFVIEISRERNKDDRDSGVMECRPNCTIVKHLLQCDTLHDLMEWKAKLNHILAVFQEWNVKGQARFTKPALYL